MLDLLDALHRAGGRSHVRALARNLGWDAARVLAVAKHFGLTVDGPFVSVPTCNHMNGGDL